MRFTPSTAMLLANNALFRVVDWTAYYRIVTDLHGEIDGADFIECTERVANGYVSSPKIPSMASRAEFSVGVSVPDQVQLEVDDATWWRENIFANLDETHYCEFKIEGRCGISKEAMAADIVYAFSGLVDKKPSSSERDDLTSITIFSYDEMMNKIPAERITTQYLNSDVDGAGLDGLALPNVFNLYITNAAVGGFILLPGVHVVDYELNGGGGAQRARLDGGAWTTIGGSTGVKTLVSASGLEKLEVYAASTAQLLSASKSFKIVVITSGTTLPQQYFEYVGVQNALRLCADRVGIDNFEFGDMGIPTKDGSKRGSFIDYITDGDAAIQKNNAIASDGTNLWISSGNLLFKRDMSSGIYELKQTLGSTEIIRVMQYNARNGHLWIFCSNGSLYRLVTASNTLSSVVALTTNVWWTSIQVIDTLKASGTTYEYCILANNSSTVKVKRVDGSSLAVTDLGSGAGFTRGGAFVRSGTEYWLNTSGDYRRWVWDVFGALGGVPDAWYDDGGQGLGLTYAYQHFAYHPTEDRIYYFANELPRRIDSHPRTSNTITNISSLYSDNNNFDNDTAVFYSMAEDAVFIAIWNQILYRLESNTATNVGTGFQSKFGAFTDHDSQVFGVDVQSRLYRYSDMLSPYIEYLDVEGLKVKDLYVKILRGFGILGRISAAKVGKYFMRADASGNPQTTGNSITLDSDNVEQVEEAVEFISKINYVTVDNNTLSTTYDGTDFDVKKYDLDITPLSVTNDFIPSSMVQDIAKWFYDTFSKNFNLYKIIMACFVPWWNEVFDEAVVDLPDQKIPVSGSGVIFEFTILPEGNTEIGVLIES